MPSILKIRVIEARDLPVMDRSSDLTDAYVELRFADYATQKTHVCWKTLNPVWYEEFRFEVTNDADLQNWPLEVKIRDHDQLTADNTIGMVCIDLNSLITLERTKKTEEPMMDGWFPIYDTMKGSRGQLHLQVKLELFEDVNRFKDSSAGVKFLTTPYVPVEFNVISIDGFVEELIIESDPEYHWSDTFRTNRSSNEARQRLLFHLSGNVRRLLGKKVLEMGCNTVLGYKEYFDFEGEQRGIVVRAIGTACRLIQRWTFFLIDDTDSISTTDSNEKGGVHVSSDNGDRFIMSNPSQPLNSSKDLITSEEKPGLSIKGNLVGVSHHQHQVTSSSLGKHATSGRFDSNFDMMITSSLPMDIEMMKPIICPCESGVLTLEKFPEGGIRHLGGMVSARSVKLLDNNSREIRDAWWSELRLEIISHAKVMGCDYIIGYSETTSIHSDLCILSASGTAVVLNFNAFNSHFSTSVTRQRSDSMDTVNRGISPYSKEELHEMTDEITKESPTVKVPLSCSSNTTAAPGTFDRTKFSYESNQIHHSQRHYRTSVQCRLSPCSMCHIPYGQHETLFSMNFTKCLLCRKRRVPEFIMATIEPPSELWISGYETLIEATVCREKKDKEGETHATMISEMIPFLEYELHRQLTYKVKLNGLNAIFGVRFHIVIGESLVIGVATGTAYLLPSLPMPAPLKIEGTLRFSNDSRMSTLRDSLITFSEHQRRLIETSQSTRSYSDWPYHDFIKKQSRSKNRTTTPLQRSRQNRNDENFPDKHASNPTTFYEEDMDDMDFLSSSSSSSTSSLVGSPLSFSSPRKSPGIGDFESHDSKNSDDKERIMNRNERPTAFVVEIDDKVDENILRLLRRFEPPEGCQISCAQRPLVMNDPMKRLGNIRMLSLISRTSLQEPNEISRTDDDAHSLSEQLQTMLYSLIDQICFETSSLRPVTIWGLSFKIRIPRARLVEIAVTALMATVHELSPDDPEDGSKIVIPQCSQLTSQLLRHLEISSSQAPHLIREEHLKTQRENEQEGVFAMDHGDEVDGQQSAHSLLNTPRFSLSKSRSRIRPSTSNNLYNELNHQGIDESTLKSSSLSPTSILILPIIGELPFLSSCVSNEISALIRTSAVHHRPFYSSLLTIDHYIGRLNLHFIREGHEISESGGLGSFVHGFLMEAQASIRSHVGAMRGNAVISCHLEDCIILDNPVKDQVYCLFTITGDVVQLSSMSQTSSCLNICK